MFGNLSLSEASTILRDEKEFFYCQVDDQDGNTIFECYGDTAEEAASRAMYLAHLHHDRSGLHTRTVAELSMTPTERAAKYAKLVSDFLDTSVTIERRG